VTLVAVTKLVPLDKVRTAAEAGVGHFGENYAKELAAKAPEVPATWHFLGKLQRGNAARVVEHADVIHSAEPGAALDRVARRAAARRRAIPCLVQVDFTGRRQGVSPEAVEGFLRGLRGREGIEPIGLMTLPPWTGDPEEARPLFAGLRLLRDQLRETWPEIGELSMGMSGDYAVAVEEGATMLRIGTALFGERPAAT
jgi:pyridoxal phosphate enzyme (YggS family)